jgi:hypothetical protein
MIAIPLHVKFTVFKYDFNSHVKPCFKKCRQFSALIKLIVRSLLSWVARCPERVHSISGYSLMKHRVRHMPVGVLLRREVNQLFAGCNNMRYSWSFGLHCSSAGWWRTVPVANLTLILCRWLRFGERSRKSHS